jgi:hypothetical protein
MSLGPDRALNSGFARRRYTDLHLYRFVQLFQDCFYIAYRGARRRMADHGETKPPVWIECPSQRTRM